ncbi:MAG: hypothetical protein ACT4OI_04425, partial [Methanobacteriota archaeon]
PASEGRLPQAARLTAPDYGFVHQPAVPSVPGAMRWGPAIGYGFLAALLGGAVWGVILGVTEYIFALLAVGIGAFIGWAMRRGAGRVSVGVIGVAAVLTLFSVYIGEIVAISIWIMPLGGTPADAVAIYPLVAAGSPGDTFLSYVFGLIGVAVSARYLWREMGAQRYAERASGYPPIGMRGPGGEVGPPPVPTTLTAAAPLPSVEVRIRKSTRVLARVTVPTPDSHSVDLEFESLFGTATVEVDGKRHTKVRVWGREKVVDLELPGTNPQKLSVRFWGSVTPRIDISWNGKLVQSV